MSVLSERDEESIESGSGSLPLGETERRILGRLREGFLGMSNLLQMPKQSLTAKAREREFKSVQRILYHSFVVNHTEEKGDRIVLWAG